MSEAWKHDYMGLCPDETQPDSRDPECPACRHLEDEAKDAVQLMEQRDEAVNLIKRALEFLELFGWFKEPAVAVALREDIHDFLRRTSVKKLGQTGLKG